MLFVAKYALIFLYLHYLVTVVLSFSLTIKPLF